MSTARPTRATPTTGRVPAQRPAQRSPWPSDLPLTPPEAVEVGESEPPVGGAGTPRERRVSEISRRPFVRPPGEEIDFARVVRRSDLSRRAARVAWAGLLLGGLCLLGYLLVPSAVLLVATGVAALTSVGAGAVRSHLDGAAVPRLRR